MRRAFVLAALFVAACGSSTATRTNEMPETPEPDGGADTPSDASTAGDAARDGSPANDDCTFRETFDDESFDQRWVQGGKVKSTATRTTEGQRSFLRLTAPGGTFFLGRTIATEWKKISVRGQMRLFKASPHGEVDAFRLVAAAPESGADQVAASVVRADDGGGFVAETVFDEQGNGPAPIALGTETAKDWTPVAITLDRTTQKVTVSLGASSVTSLAFPARMATGPIALQLGAAWNYDATEWTIDVDDICAVVTP